MFLFVINHAVYASVLSLFYPILGFGYALLLEDPRPSKVIGGEFSRQNFF